MLDPSRSNPTIAVGGHSISSTQRKDDEDPEVEVNLNDQKMINEFSNLNLRRMKVKKLIKSKSLELDDLIELENELLLSSFDDDPTLNPEDDDDDQKQQPQDLGLHPGLPDDVILYKLDSSYIHIKRSTFQETKLIQNLESLRSSIGSLNSNLNELNDQMSNLKKVLYSKFGNTINLESGEEEDDDDDDEI